MINPCEHNLYKSINKLELRIELKIVFYYFVIRDKFETLLERT